MAVLKVYSLDDTQEQAVISTLPEGEHIIGRGALLNCNDKRISRKHAVISVHKDMAVIKAVHVNPCFFKQAEGNNITILPKDTSVILNDGDQFAFLADLFWFRVRLLIDNNNVQLECTSHAEVTDAEMNGTKGAEDTAVNISEHTDSNPTSNKRSLEEENLTETCKRQKTPIKTGNLLATSSNGYENCLPIDQEPVDGQNINSSRLIANILSIVEEDFGSGPTNRDQVIGAVSTQDGENPSSQVACSSNGNTVQIKRANTDMEDVNVEKEDSTNFSNNIIPIKKEIAGENIDNEDASVPGNSNITKIKEEPKQKQENIADQAEIKNTGEASSSNKLPTDTVKRDGEEISQNEGEAKKDQGQSGASCSKDSEDKHRRRERCWYGPACYRKNPVHRSDYSHPGDDDYNSDPDDDRPVCPFGAACYRKNMDHRRQFKHPNAPAHKQNDGGDGKPNHKRSPTRNDQTSDDDSEDQSDNNDSLPKKRVTRKPKNKMNYDSPDDYDFNDPFIDDASSDEFVLSEDGDDDDDDSTQWEDSQAVNEESQETRRLLKEAKRFAKAKKKK